MRFELSIFIDRPPATVFVFLRDKDKHPQEEDSPVLLLEKTTPGPVDVGARYREVVQMLPFYRGEIMSIITRFEADRLLQEEFEGPGMNGRLTYQFLIEGRGTLLVQREWLEVHGLLKLLAPLIRLALERRLQERLQGIKRVLEGGQAIA